MARKKSRRRASGGSSVRDAPRAAASSSINRAGLAVAVAGLVGLFALVVILGPGEAPPPDAGPIQLLEGDTPEPVSALDAWRAAPEQEIPISERDFARGAVDAPVEIVEFSDFECPYCRKATESLRSVLERYPSEVKLVYKNFPLDQSCNEDMAQQLHPSACRAAVMARCAGAQEPEKFWSFHDAVFASSRLSGDFLDAVARDLELDGEAFASCIEDGRALDEVRSDVGLALSLKLYSTPTIFVNRRQAPSYSVDALSEIIDHVLSRD